MYLFMGLDCTENRMLMNISNVYFSIVVGFFRVLFSFLGVKME